MKLTKFQSEEIRRRYLAKEKSQPKLALEYGVSVMTISNIVRGYVPKSQYRDLDDIDQGILKCIKESEGLSMMDVYRCVNLELGNFSEQLLRYRINSLEAMGVIYTVRVKGQPPIRRCYLPEQKKFEQLVSRVRDGNDG